MDPRNQLDNMAAVVTSSFLVDNILNQQRQNTSDAFENRIAAEPTEPYISPHGILCPPSQQLYSYGGERRMVKYERQSHHGQDLGSIYPRNRIDSEYQRRPDEQLTFGDLKTETRHDLEELSCMVAEAERKAVRTNQVLTQPGDNSKFFIIFREIKSEK